MEFKIKPFFVAVGAVIVALATFFLQRLFSTNLTGKVNIPSKKETDLVSEEEYKEVTIKDEEEASTKQTEKIDAIIDEASVKIEETKKDTNISSIKDTIDSGWDKL